MLIGELTVDEDLSMFADGTWCGKMDVWDVSRVWLLTTMRMAGVNGDAISAYERPSVRPWQFGNKCATGDPCEFGSDAGVRS